MKTRIDVESREEGEQIRRGLQDPATRALVKVMGLMSTLPTDRSRARVLRCVDDKFDEEDAQYVSVFR